MVARPVRPPSAREPALAGRRPLPQLLRRAWYGLNQAFRRRIAHLEITPDQYTALRNLADAGRDGLTQSALTARMTSDPNTIASLVERMEEGALLRRETDPLDRRARRLYLAPAGRRRFLAARKVAMALQEEVLAVVPEAERHAFFAALEAIGDACRQASERGASHGPTAAALGRAPAPALSRPATHGR